jgi:hypothetical protein
MLDWEYRTEWHPVKCAFMSDDKPVKKLTGAARKIADEISAHTLKVARPLFWHIGARNEGVPRGATAFILRFEHRFVAVTADHVIEEYFADLDADKRTMCQLSSCRVWPEKSLIARSTTLDMASFEIDPGQLAGMGADTIDCRGQWPPPDVSVGDSLTLTGFLDTQRAKIAAGHYEMRAWGAHGIADAVTERDIVTIYDPESALSPHDAVAKPPVGFNMSGCSGGPVILVKQVNGLVRWFPVGLIYKGPNGKAEGELASFDRIHTRRLHFLQPNGSINEPNTGWLPN